MHTSEVLRDVRAGGEMGMKEYIVQAITQETIDSFDAHSAPELIRCKDCKHYKKDTCSAEAGMAFPPPDDWFCADGERR